MAVLVLPANGASNQPATARPTELRMRQSQLGIKLNTSPHTTGLNSHGMLGSGLPAPRAMHHWSQQVSSTASTPHPPILPMLPASSTLFVLQPYTTHPPHAPADPADKHPTLPNNGAIALHGAYERWVGGGRCHSPESRCQASPAPAPVLGAANLCLPPQPLTSCSITQPGRGVG
ncbi:hypothetical protein HaLaN_05161 [Haematococcus lacustris]|uniref:Uncharacterized protein n=1 Tax=Haematococcus lacustris TaxID=44745 RepID=A0A699YIA8_HAELA|nr:hypothetical protein HaLaN_05161 [Haematococcus lacustris]